MKNASIILASFGALFLASAASAETINCTNIATLPATITVQGVYCLKQDLATNIASGAAMTIATNNVTIDFNGFKLGGLAAGPNTRANGVFAENRQNITLRNGNIRGFMNGIYIHATTTASSGHVIEDNLLDSNTQHGIFVSGSGILVRDNRVVNTMRADSAYAIYGNLHNSRIVGNLITGTVSNTSQSLGLALSSLSNNVEVFSNTILDTRGNSVAIGIWTNSAGHVVADNVVIGVTSATAAYGISNTSASLICRNNTVANVTTTPTVGCTAETGTFPPP
jgi:hypothetical protein